MYFSLQRWTRIVIFNLLLLSAIGVILRYKIVFSLPFIDQKHLLHGHSHFAFTGWITQAIMVLLVGLLAERTSVNVLKRYGLVLFINLIAAYGMLFTFPIEGYGPYSLTFSTLAIIVSYVFSVMYWKDLNKLPTREVSFSWFKAALVFNVISSLGAYALATMMISKTAHQNWYLAAEYFYLHFQYNGWFFFACMGLFTAKLIKLGLSQQALKKVYWLFTGSLIPAYFLSVLWMNFPLWIYIIIVTAAFAQVGGWLLLLQLLKKRRSLLKEAFTPVARWLMGLSAIALTIKLLLQLGSVIPSLSDLSYGFRPIIIGYLHLVLLGVITIFLLGFMVAQQNIQVSRLTISGFVFFVSGIIINEILLMVQGVFAMTYTSIPFMNEILFSAALLMFAGLAVINISQLQKPN